MGKEINLVFICGAILAVFVGDFQVFIGILVVLVAINYLTR